MTGDGDDTGSGGPSDPLRDYARIVSDLSHDLRTPLTSIVGAASSLVSYADRFDPATRARLLQSVVDEAEHLDRLLSNLSLLAKARGGALIPYRRDTRLADLLAAAATRADRRDDGVGVRLADDVPEATLAVDAGLLRDAILNLLGVAARFAGQGSDMVVSARVQGDVARIAWRCGIGSGVNEKVRRLLEAFHARRRGEGVRASDFILLEAAREVVQCHGGRLAIDNDNNGLGMVVELPTRS